MYLNSYKCSKVSRNADVKPGHEMYLNFLNPPKLTTWNCVKPGHEMYLNGAEFLLLD